MSWFERRRQRAVEALRGEAAVVGGVPFDQEVGPGAGPAVDAVRDLAVEDVAVEQAHLPEVTDPDAMPTVRGRAGRYVIIDGAGAEVGTILGDYVIGFTVQCWDVNRTFSDMESAMAAVALESQARAAARLLKAS